MLPKTNSLSESVEKEAPTHSKTKLYKKRYLILILFILLSMSNAFQWIEYAIIENIITQYYNTTTFWVNSTSVIFEASYVVGIIPATYLLDKKGLRFCVILGAIGNAVGSWIKCITINPNSFWLQMTAQTIVAFSQLFILNIPPLLAAVWFSDKELSRATAYGVFGNQLGIAFGFFIPSLLVPSFRDIGSDTTAPNTTTLMPSTSTTTEPNDDIEQVGRGLRVLYFGVAVITTVLLILIIIFFKDKPELPPSTAQANAQVLNENSSFISSLKNLFTNLSFVSLLVTYGLNAGVFYAVSTVLNQMVTTDIGNNYVSEAGYMGFTLTMAGIVGSIVCGFLLDWTQRFKGITLGIYLFSLIGMIVFTIALKLRSVWALFVASAILGFFLTGYLPIGFEVGAEVTYPEPEGTSAGLLNTSAQIFGIIFTFGGSAVIDAFNSLSANIGFICVLTIGFCGTALMKVDLKRKANKLNTNNQIYK